MKKNFKATVTEKYSKTVVDTADGIDDFYNMVMAKDIVMVPENYVSDSIIIGEIEEITQEEAIKLKVESVRRISGVVLSASNEWIDTFTDQTVEEVIKELSERSDIDQDQEYYLFETFGPSVELKITK